MLKAGGFSRRTCLALSGAAAAVGCMPGSAWAAAPVINVLDTVSGPNFQDFWKSVLIPAVRQKTGVEIHYTVGSGSTLQLQMQSWTQNRPEFSLLFLKDLDLANLQQSGAKLETIYPSPDIPNDGDEAKAFMVNNNGVDLDGKGVLFWRAQFDLIYNSAFIKKPPATWKEFFARRKDFDGHIGLIRPDASSGGGRAFIYSFLAAFGADFSQPFAQVQASPTWKSAWTAFHEFSKSFAQPIASSPPVMFRQFQTEQAWVSVYAQDYTLWSASQGQLPSTMKAAPLDKNIIGASNAFLAVPAVDSPEQKQAAYKVINELISPDIQIKMLETMYQYPGTDAWKQAPDPVWSKIPKVDQAEATGIQISNLGAVTYIQEHGMEHIAS